MSSYLREELAHLADWSSPESTPAAKWAPEHWDLKSVACAFSKQRNVCMCVVSWETVAPDILCVCLSVKALLQRLPLIQSPQRLRRQRRRKRKLSVRLFVGTKHWSELLQITTPLITNYVVSVEICNKQYNYDQCVKICSWHWAPFTMVLIHLRVCYPFLCYITIKSIKIWPVISLICPLYFLCRSRREKWLGSCVGQL